MHDMYMIDVLPISFVDKVIATIKTYSIVSKLSTTEQKFNLVITNHVKRGGIKIVFSS